MPDFVGTLAAALLTVMVLSYLIRDNPLFRVATYVFVGVAAGYAGALAWHSVLKPGLVTPLLNRGLTGLADPLVVVPWVLVLLLLLKLSPETSSYGTLPLALMVGVGAATVVGGAVTGTLLPQSLAAMDTLSPTAVSPQTGETGIERMVSVLILLTGTLSTLLYFRFTARRTPMGETRRGFLIRVAAAVGRGFIAVTFGVMYAGAVSATLIVFVERIQFLIDLLRGWLIG